MRISDHLCDQTIISLIDVLIFNLFFFSWYIVLTNWLSPVLLNSSGSEGVVEDVVLLGAPVEGSEKAWERMTRVVAGKIVNGYCR